MPAKTRSRDNSGSSATRSPETKRLYPKLADLDFDDDEDDGSWVMSGGEDVTMSSTDVNDSSYLEDSPGVRQSIHQSDSSFQSPRLRSGKRYGRTSFTDHSDDASFTSNPRSPQIKIEHQSKKPADDQSNFNVLMGIVLFIIILVIITYFSMNFTSDVQNTPDPDLYVQFKLQMAAFKGKFQSQSVKSWKALNVGTKHILMDPQPVYPAVFLMVGSTKSLRVMNCISSGMISIINSLYNVTQINKELSNIPVSELDRRSTSREKLDLDKRLHEVFSTGYKGAMLVNVEQLSPDAALMLHSYCDNDNAPFKNILLILELVSDEVDPQESKLSTSVEEYLRSLWEKDLGTDKLMALLSRIGNNVILVNPESADVLNTACP